AQDKDYGKREEIIQSYIRENFILRAHQVMGYENDVPYSPYYLKYLEVPAAVWTYPYLRALSAFGNYPVENSFLKEITSEYIEKIASRGVIYFKGKPRPYLSFREWINWQGRTFVFEHLDYKGRPYLRGYTIFKDLLWGRYGIGFRGAVSYFDNKGKEYLWKTSSLYRMKIGKVTYTVLQGEFKISKELKDPLNNYHLIYTNETILPSKPVLVYREIKNGEGRVVSRESYRGFNSALRPYGEPIEITFFKYPHIYYSHLRVFLPNLGIPSEGVRYKYQTSLGEDYKSYLLKGQRIGRSYDLVLSVYENRPVGIYKIEDTSRGKRMLRERISDLIGGWVYIEKFRRPSWDFWRRWKENKILFYDKDFHLYNKIKFAINDKGKKIEWLEKSKLTYTVEENCVIPIIIFNLRKSYPHLEPFKYIFHSQSNYIEPNIGKPRRQRPIKLYDNFSEAQKALTHSSSSLKDTPKEGLFKYSFIGISITSLYFTGKALYSLFGGWGLGVNFALACVLFILFRISPLFSLISGYFLILKESLRNKEVYPQVIGALGEYIFNVFNLGRTFPPEAENNSIVSEGLLELNYVNISGIFSLLLELLRQENELGEEDIKKLFVKEDEGVIDTGDFTSLKNRKYLEYLLGAIAWAFYLGFYTAFWVKKGALRGYDSEDGVDIISMVDNFVKETATILREFVYEYKEAKERGENVDTIHQKIEKFLQERGILPINIIPSVIDASKSQQERYFIRRFIQNCLMGYIDLKDLMNNINDNEAKKSINNLLTKIEEINRKIKEKKDRKEKLSKKEKEEIERRVQQIKGEVSRVLKERGQIANFNPFEYMNIDIDKEPTPLLMVKISWKNMSIILQNLLNINESQIKAINNAFSKFKKREGRDLRGKPSEIIRVARELLVMSLLVNFVIAYIADREGIIVIGKLLSLISANKSLVFFIAMMIAGSFLFEGLARLIKRIRVNKDFTVKEGLIFNHWLYRYISFVFRIGAVLGSFIFAYVGITSTSYLSLKLLLSYYAVIVPLLEAVGIISPLVRDWLGYCLQGLSDTPKTPSFIRKRVDWLRSFSFFKAGKPASILRTSFHYWFKPQILSGGKYANISAFVYVSLSLAFFMWVGKLIGVYAVLSFFAPQFDFLSLENLFVMLGAGYILFVVLALTRYGTGEILGSLTSLFVKYPLKTLGLIYVGLMSLFSFPQFLNILGIILFVAGLFEKEIIQKIGIDLSDIAKNSRQYSTSKALWRKMRETWSHADWFSAFIRWSGGTPQLMSDKDVQETQDLSPLFVDAREVRAQKGKFFTLAKEVLNFIWLLPISSILGFCPFEGMDILLIITGIVLNRVLTFFGLVSDLDRCGFNKVSAIIGSLGTILFSCFFLHLPFSLPIIMKSAIVGMFLGGFIVGLKTWFKNVIKHSVLFILQPVIHDEGQIERQTLRFSISGASDKDREGVEIRERIPANKFFFRAFWIYGVGLYLLYLWMVSFNTILDNGLAMFFFIIFPAAIMTGIFAYNIPKGKYTHLGYIGKILGIVLALVSLGVLKLVAVSGSSLPAYIIIGFGLFLIIWIVSPFIKEVVGEKVEKFFKKKAEDKAKDKKECRDRPRLKRVFSEYLRYFFMIFILYLPFFGLPFLPTINFDLFGIKEIIIPTTTFFKYLGAAILAFILYSSTGELVQRLEYKNLVEGFEDIFNRFIKIAPSIKNELIFHYILNLIDEFLTSTAEGSFHYARKALQGIEEALTEPQAVLERIKTNPVNSSQKILINLVGGPSIKPLPIRNVFDYIKTMDERWKVRGLRDVLMKIIGKSENIDEIKELLGSLESKEGNKLYIYTPLQIETDSSQIQSELKNYIVKVSNDEEWRKLLRAFIIRRWLIEKNTPGGNMYPTAVSILEQLLALKEAELIENVILRFSYNKYKPAPPGDTPSLIDWGKENNHTIRESFLKLVNLLTGVDAGLSYGRTVFPFKSAALTAMLLNGGLISNWQLVVDDKSTSVYYLDRYIEDVKDVLSNHNLISKVPIRKPQSSFTDIGESVVYIEGGHGANIIGTMFAGGYAGESISTGWGNFQRMAYNEARELFRSGYPMAPVTSLIEGGSFSNNFGLRIFRGHQDYNISEDIGTIMKATYMYLLWKIFKRK
ncbi:hypothetical protein DRQ11_08245, partial [candidate division KSB1 bacterium]